MLGALAHPIFKLYEIQQKPRDTAKVWKKSKKKKKEFGAPSKNYSKSSEKYMLLEFRISKSKFDFFLFIFLLKNACNDSKKVPH